MTALDLATLVLRLTLGAIFVAQGWRKTLAPRDASHGRADLARLVGSAGLPRAGTLAFAVGAAELACGALVLLGLATLPASLALAGILAVAIARFKWSAGFVGGWDWPFACLGASLALALLGPGAISLDAALRLAR